MVETQTKVLRDITADIENKTILSSKSYHVYYNCSPHSVFLQHIHNHTYAGALPPHKHKHPSYASPSPHTQAHAHTHKHTLTHAQTHMHARTLPLTLSLCLTFSPTRPVPAAASNMVVSSFRSPKYFSTTLAAISGPL
jgi:hypothetical protein